MKYLVLAFLTCNMSILIAQTNARALYQKQLDELTVSLKEATNAEFVKGPMFYFVEPYKAVFTKESKFSKGQYPDMINTTFNQGDTVIIRGAKPIGKGLSFSKIGSEEIFETKPFGRPGFQLLDPAAFKAHVKSIKESDWQNAEDIAAMLECNALASAGKPNFEKHHLNIGDTPVFFDIRLEGEKVMLYLDLKTYGGEDFKNVGKAVGGTSKLVLSFGDGSEADATCESDNDRFAIFDMTSLRMKALTGINNLSISLSKKTVSKELIGKDKHAIGLKMECIEI